MPESITTPAAFRAWLASELALLGNASHHAYSFGQANMAKRALEHFDALAAATVTIDRAVADRGARALAAAGAQAALAPDLATLHAALTAATEVRS